MCQCQKIDNNHKPKIKEQNRAATKDDQVQRLEK
jgi:hypothetical protein